MASSKLPPVNVVDTFSWTSVPKNTPLRNEAPKVFAIAHKLKDNSIYRAAANYLQIVSDLLPESFRTAFNNLGLPSRVESRNMTPMAYYDQMYDTDVYREYVFPYFNNNVRDLQNNFNDQSPLDGTVGAKLKNFLEGAGELVQAGKAFGSIAGITEMESAGAYVETPKFYNYGENEPGISVSFPLINTLEVEDITANYNLIAELIRINRPLRKNPILVEPPVLWQVTIPGFRYLPWASCNVGVELDGVRRIVQINGKDTIIPESYNITLTFNPLTTEPSNFEQEYGGVPQ